MFGRRFDPVTNADVWVLPMQGERKPEAFLKTTFHETDARFSPDGRWVAYVSDESGRPQVYVRPFPGPGDATPISKAGGSMPRWRRDGKELFYLAGDQLMAVPVTPGSRISDFRLQTSDFRLQTLGFQAGAPVVLFRRTAARIVDFDVMADGQTFLVNSVVTGPENLPITVVVNWMAGLR